MLEELTADCAGFVDGVCSYDCPMSGRQVNLVEINGVCELIGIAVSVKLEVGLPARVEVRGAVAITPVQHPIKVGRSNVHRPRALLEVRRLPT